MKLLRPGDQDVCPHCDHGVQFIEARSGSDLVNFLHEDLGLLISVVACPLCNQIVVRMTVGDPENQWQTPDDEHTDAFQAWPAWRAPQVSNEVPPHIRQDFQEAAAVLAISTNASALLSRRCLEVVLREGGKATAYSLAGKIKQVLKDLPPRVAKQLDVVREIGNFSAHPQRDQLNGEPLTVEPGEAEWNLEVLQVLFEEYYVKPAEERARLKKLNQKLIAAGRDPIGDEEDLPDPDPAPGAESKSKELVVVGGSQAQKGQREPSPEELFPHDEDLPF